MLVTYALMALTVLTLPGRNPALAREITVMRSAAVRVPVAAASLLLTSGLLVVHVLKDMNATTTAWYFHSTPVWVIVLVAASLIHWRERRALQRAGVDVQAKFAVLPPE
jgi:ABC-type nickel/cobalt efflux system permease component RcnA